jgi:hypothetical protein
VSLRQIPNESRNANETLTSISKTPQLPPSVPALYSQTLGTCRCSLAVLPKGSSDASVDRQGKVGNIQSPMALEL